MRLLHVEHMTLVEFVEDIPQYAILSHTWDKGEITYDDIVNRPDGSEKKQGWSKLKNSSGYQSEN